MSTPGAPAAAASREPFQAFVTDEATLETVRTVIDDLGWRAQACHKGGLRAAVQTLSVSASPTMLLVDLSETADPMGEIDALAEVCEPGTTVFAIGPVNDVALYRELVARGVHDYLVKPLAPAKLAEALERARRARSAPRPKSGEEEAEHVSVAVVGARGGVGASMLATSLAWLLSTQENRATALLDLDLHFGTAALALDLEPGRGLLDALDDPARIDSLFIDRAAVRAGDKLSILSAEAPLGARLAGDGTAFTKLDQGFRQGFEATVIDLPRSVMLEFPQLLAAVGTLLLVTEPTLASARDAIRILGWLKLTAPDMRTLVVANKVHAAGGEISAADFAAAIERPLDFTIPFDHKGALQAARVGRTFAEANRAGKAAAPLMQLARVLVAEAPRPPEAAAPADKAVALFDRLGLGAMITRVKRPARPATRVA